VRHQQLVEAVKAEYTAAKGMAGRRQLTRLLKAKGVEISESTVGAIMAAHELRAIRTAAWKQTTVQDPQARTEHLVNHMVDDQGNRDFTSAEPGTRLVGDITYLKTGQGWLYLATVIDLCTGMVIGWNTANHMRTDLCIGALAMARDQGYFHPDLVVYHTDRGAQFTSVQFQAWCAGNGVTQSMGRTGVCWDNSVAENWFSHFKTEFYHHHRFATHREAEAAVLYYIESWYNRRRPNGRAGGYPPMHAWTEYQTSSQELLAA
jgi:transposase InsO family protein